MAQPVRTRYTRTSGVDIAYQVVGEGPDLLFIPGFVSNIDLQWEHPGMAAFYRRLASFSRLILFDKRGTGVSERVTADRIPSLEERMDDVRAVLDAAGSERADLFGISEGGPLSLLLTATYPERVERLALFGTFAADPFVDPGLFERDVRRLWGRGRVFSLLAPSWANDEATVAFLARYERQSATPDGGRPPGGHDLGDRRSLDAVVDLRTHPDPASSGRRRSSRSTGPRSSPRGSPGAELVALDGVDHYACVDPDPMLDRVEQHVTGAAPAPPTERVLTTMLFVDVVSSTSQAARVGDARWRDLLGELFDRARRQLARTGGTLVNTTGDGLLATFDGPARAVRCGLALVADLGNHRSRRPVQRPHLRGGADGRRHHRHRRPRRRAGWRAWPDRARSSSPRRCGTSSSGSGLQFEPRGRHELRGVPDRWDLYAATG